jgi:hypothetical protein
MLILLLSGYPAIADTQTVQPPAPIVQPADSIVVPSGTVVPLTLTSPIMSLSTKPGDTVRALVAFPILIGSQVAIPAGTYVEGIANTIERKNSRTHQPAVQIHFIRLLYASGYVVTLDANNTAAVFLPSSPGAPAAQVVNAGYSPSAPAAHYVTAAYAQAPHAYPDPPQFDGSDHPLHIILPAIAGFIALIVGIFMLAHHHSTTVANKTDTLLWDAGTQFQMTLSAPLVVDASKVNAAPAQAMNTI